MKTIKIEEKTWKGLRLLKAQLNLKTYSETIESVLHTAIVNMYMNMEPGEKEPKEIKELEKAMGWKRPL